MKIIKKKRKMRIKQIFINVLVLIPSLIFGQDSEIIFPIKHSSFITSLKYSPTKQYIATTSADCTIKLWQASNNLLIRTFYGHTEIVNCIDFSVDGSLLASGANDSTVIIWDVVTGGKKINNINTGGKVLTIAFNHNGQNIIAGTNNGNIIIINISSGIIDNKFSFPQYKITHLGFAKENNKLLVSTSKQNENVNLTNEIKSEGSLYLFDFENFQKPIAISNYKENVINFCFSPDSEKIITAASNGMVRVWKTKDYIEEIGFKNTNLTPAVVFMSGNGKMVCVASQKDNTINLWRISGEKLFDFTIEKGKAVYGEFNNDFTRIHICNNFGLFIIYDFNARIRDTIGEYLQSESTLSSFAISKSSSQLAIAFGNGVIKGFNLSALMPVKYTSPQSTKVLCMTFSTDEKKLCISNDQSVIYNYNNNKTEAGPAIVTFLETATGSIKSVIPYSSEYVTSLTAFSNYCLSGVNSGIIKFNEIENAKEISQIPAHDYDVIDMNFSSDFKWLITGSTDATAKLWKVEGSLLTLKNLFQFNNEVNNVNYISSNQIVIASVVETGLYIIKGLKTENKIAIEEKNGISDIDVSENDTLLFASINSNQTQCRSYSYLTGVKIWEFKETGSKIKKIFYSIKYNILFCALENGSIILINAKTGKKLATIILYSGKEWLVYTPDNYFDASTSILPNINIVSKLIFLNHQGIEKYYQKGILAKILMQ